MDTRINQYELISKVFGDLFIVNAYDKKRIEHTVKMHNYARQIGVSEGFNVEQQLILELTALLHDIGIQISLKKHNSSAAKYQQLEGPAIAKEILENYDVPSLIIDRVCYIIAHHHTYTAIDDSVFQVIVEADFLVNAVEDDCSEKQIATFRDKYFSTSMGSCLLELLVG